MKHNTERILLLIAGIYSLMTCIFQVILIGLIKLTKDFLTNNQEFKQVLNELRFNIDLSFLTVSAIFSLLLAIMFLVLRTILSTSNEKNVAIILIAISITYFFNLMDTVSAILAVLTSVLILKNSGFFEKYKNRGNQENQNDD